MAKTRYICLEGGEGVGKTTQVQKLVDYLREKGFKVLQTKEPGTPHSPLTMFLRGVMLDNRYEAEMTRQARELISQAIRSIHIDKVVAPAMGKYDFIIQDRGHLSGLAYGMACDNDIKDIDNMASYIGSAPGMYDDVIYLRGNIKEGLDKALSAKQEFEAGDAMESRGVNFLHKAATNMQELAYMYNTTTIDVDGKGIDRVFKEILAALKL